MNNYHNGDITFEEAWELALYVDKEILKKLNLKSGEYSQKVNDILSNPDYLIYNRNKLQIFLEKNEASFIARNEKIE